jgi:hypothetical protein
MLLTTIRLPLIRIFYKKLEIFVKKMQNYKLTKIPTVYLYRNFIFNESIPMDKKEFASNLC